MKNPAHGRHLGAMISEERLLGKRMIASLPMIAALLLTLCAWHHRNKTPGSDRMGLNDTHKLEICPVLC